MEITEPNKPKTNLEMRKIKDERGKDVIIIDRKIVNQPVNVPFTKGMGKIENERVSEDGTMHSTTPIPEEKIPIMLQYYEIEAQKIKEQYDKFNEDSKKEDPFKDVTDEKMDEYAKSFSEGVQNVEKKFDEVKDKIENVEEFKNQILEILKNEMSTITNYVNEKMEIKMAKENLDNLKKMHDNFNEERDMFKKIIEKDSPQSLTYQS